MVLVVNNEKNGLRRFFRLLKSARNCFVRLADKERVAAGLRSPKNGLARDSFANRRVGWQRIDLGRRATENGQKLSARGLKCEEDAYERKQ